MDEREIIKELMWRERVTQKDIATGLGTSQQSISAMMKRSIRMEKLIAICKLLSADVIIRRGEEEWSLSDR